MAGLGHSEQRRLPRMRHGAIAVPVTAQADLSLLQDLSLRGADIFELRLDMASCASARQTTALAESYLGHPTIMTCRSVLEGGLAGDDRQRMRILKTAAPYASAVDIELSSGDLVRTMRELTSQANNELIVSYHDIERTPDAATLAGIIDRALDAGADIVKIATTLQGRADIDVLLAVLGDAVAGGKPLAIMGMGNDELAGQSRVATARGGSLFVFAQGGKSSAPGQPSLDWLAEQLDRSRQHPALEG